MAAETIRIGMAQINCSVGDISGNSQKICDYIDKAVEQKVDIVSFPEMALTGYPPEDLLLKTHFIDKNLDELNRIVEHTGDITAVVGFVDKANDNIYNAAAVINNKKVLGIYHKIFLPNYGVFDEMRYFQPGSAYPVYDIKGIPVGVNICEDIWHPDGPTHKQVIEGGAKLIININSSPYYIEKWKVRQKMLVDRVKENPVFIAYNNMVGGQDELVFDGHGMVLDTEGNIIASGKQFEEELITIDISLSENSEETGSTNNSRKITIMGLYEEVYSALTLCTRDYVHKNHFEKVVIGLSGGIDSALTVVVAVDALGKDNVSGIYMPSQYSLESSEVDARKFAENIGIDFSVIPIMDIFSNYLELLKEPFKGLDEDVTEENIQARIRGNILMSVSNKFGWLVLSTGNKSETSVGYCTLYGDMAGGFAVIKDVPKTLVYKLCEYRNSIGDTEIIPKNVLVKEPTAELKEDQLDSDTLPPYEVLDAILHDYIEDERSSDYIINKGFDRKLVERVIRMVDINEYKRRQAPPGVKITPKAFGKDRRMPITNNFRDYVKSN
jgi:NAD+ synthase (glutamine-hydrolysing)